MARKKNRIKAPVAVVKSYLAAIEAPVAVVECKCFSIVVLKNPFIAIFLTYKYNSLQKGWMNQISVLTGYSSGLLSGRIPDIKRLDIGVYLL